MDTTFWELTNEQRRCFGIAPIDASWQRVQLPRGRYDQYDTCIYVDGEHVRYIVCHGADDHFEHALDETLTPDGKFIVPKRSSKPIKLSAATITKRSPIGMCLSYHRYHLDDSGNVSLYNATSSQDFYRSWVAGDQIGLMDDFQKWCDQWLAETTEADLAAIADFASCSMKTVKPHEGDVFRFRWNRRQWGYGRILLDYALMRRKKIPFYDCLMGKPLVIEVFKLVTDDPNLPLETILAHGAIPSQNIMDNALHYGEFEIIGHAPLPENRDDLCPIMYGVGPAFDGILRYQQGRIYRELPQTKPLSERDYKNNAVGWSLNTTADQMQACIQQGDEAYWTQLAPLYRLHDLRNPDFAEDLKAIRNQMGV